MTIALITAALRDFCRNWKSLLTGEEFSRRKITAIQEFEVSVRAEERSTCMKIADLRIQELEDAIRRHRDERGDDRCFLDDARLYAVLNDGGAVDNSLPPMDVFLGNCERFWKCRQAHPDPAEAECVYRLQQEPQP